MKTKIALLAFASAASIVVPAVAGLKLSQPVQVFTTGTKGATGSLGSARASSDSTAYIGCEVDGSTITTQTLTMECFASDAAGNFVTCGSSNPIYVTTASAMTANSRVTFYADANGNCIDLYVTNGSYNAPVTP
jgi:hypothetical protein